MSSTHSRRRLNPLTLPQILTAFFALCALFVIFGLSQNASQFQQVSANEATIQAGVFIEETKQVQYEATLAYVESDAYVKSHLQEEENKQLEGEVVVRPFVTIQDPEPIVQAEPTQDPAMLARPWQFWWYLLTDAEPPQAR